MNRKALVLISGLVVIAALAIFIILDQTKKSPSEVSQIDVAANQSVDNKIAGLEVDSEDKFQTIVPENIKVPEANEVLSLEQAEKIAVPTVVVEAAPGAVSKYRNFNIRAEDNKFIPSQIIANEGDTVQINFTAIDKDYDIVFPSYRMKQTAKQGETKMLAFQALKAGNFTYYCELCGGMDSGVAGNIIIVP